MTTLAELRATVRTSIPNLTVWPDTLLDVWIKAGIGHYSERFPRLWMNSITAVADTQSYDLPANATSIETVEFPAGEDPASYLLAVNRVDSRMLIGDDVYAITGTDDGETAVQNGRLTIAPVVAGGETLTIGYRAPHPAPVNDESVITVPDQHMGILVQYCSWSAYQAQLAAEVAEPYRNMNLVGQLTKAVESAWSILDDLMAGVTVLETAVTSSSVVVWDNENTERIY